METFLMMLVAAMAPLVVLAIVKDRQASRRLKRDLKAIEERQYKGRH